MRDIVIRTVANGYVASVMPSHDPGYVGTEYVFSDPEALSDWINHYLTETQKPDASCMKQEVSNG